MRWLAVVTVAACASELPTSDEATNDPVPLRALAAQRGIALGTAIDTKPLHDDPLYGEIAAYQLDMVVAETKMKMAALQPAQGTFDFAAADAIVDFAEANAMAVRGHTLVYPLGSPAWLLDGTWTRDELLGIVTDHITQVVTHYRGRVAEWDVVNEPFDYQPGDAAATLDDKLFTNVIGPDYIELALRAARAADPTAKLFVNESGIELPGPKLDAVRDMVSDFLARGVPIDAIGMEFHVPLDAAGDLDATLADVATAMQTLTDLGIEIHVTELDVRTPAPADDDALARQATLYAGIVHACLATPRCTGVVMWGFSDRHSWIPDQFPGYGDACMLDDEYRFKPAYHALHDELAN